MFTELWQTVAEAKATVPVPQLLVFLAVLSVCLLFRLTRTGLILSFLYTFYLGWLFCAKELIEKDPDYEVYGIGYIFFGGLILLLSVIGMIMKKAD